MVGGEAMTQYDGSVSCPMCRAAVMVRKLHKVALGPHNAGGRTDTMQTIRPTRYLELGYRNDGRGLWRIYALDGTPAAVGPHYASKAELLADLNRYAKEYGCEVRA